MKRHELITYLRSQECEFVREGSRHSWWQNRARSKRSAVPRHTEISNDLARKICRDLGVPPIR